jgi:ATP-binding cassette subfamily F protein 3
VVVGYAADAPVLKDLNLRIDQDDRIALLGQNGNGKSTFAKLIAGKLAPLSGAIFGAKRVDVGYFAQHQLDELNPAKTPYDHMLDLMPEATEAQRRTRLGSYGFSADKADTKCANLSGGEKARLLLALAAFHGPHLLILDEPTNHLDVDSREALVHALAEYEGAVILISHDRHLIEASVDRLWLVADGTVTVWDGDLDDYRRVVLSRRSGDAPGSGEASAARRRSPGGGSGGTLAQTRRREAARRRAEVAPLRQKVKESEALMERLRKEIQELDLRLSDSSLYGRDPVEAARLAKARAGAGKALAMAEDRWFSATAAYEAASAG